MLSNTFAQELLNYQEFLKQVKEFHPLSKRSENFRLQGSFLVRQARGGFDPVLSTKMKEKYYSDKYYYTMFGTDLTINTITGISLSAGFDNNSGLYVNPENYTTKGGLGYMGLSVPLGKGLFIDENRLALRGAEQVQNQYNAEADLQMNDILFAASQTYWDWYANYFIAQNLRNSVELAKNRFVMIKQEESVGESSAVDTLKAYLQMQDRVLEQIEAERNLTSSYFELLKWIWDDNLLSKSQFVPDEKSYVSMQLMGQVSQANLTANNPKINQLTAKIAEQKIEQRYKIEKIKPKLNFDYQMLYNQVFPSFNGFGNNQIWGLSFQYALFTRAERSALQLTKLKISNLDLELKNAQRELDLKLQNESSQLVLLENQENQTSQILDDYTRLLDFENIKFDIGESTLFELNAWELKLLETQNKLVKTQQKYAVTQAKVLWYNNSWLRIL
jgi:outer membrane protein TolC